jgi:hypothetical protein
MKSGATENATDLHVLALEAFAANAKTVSITTAPGNNTF